MADPELSQHTDGITTAVLHKRAGDDLHRVRNSAERPALDARDAPCLRVQTDADRHLGRAAARCEDRVEEHVPRDGHRVCEVAVDLVEDVLGRAAEKDCAGFGC